MKKTALLKQQKQQKIRDQIQQLRNIRKMMFDTFENPENSSNGETKQEKPLPSNPQKPTEKPSTDQESPQNQSYDNLYRKLKSTVQLLSESLEEQGNLKALLELTSNPSVYESILQSEVFHLSQMLNLNDYNANNGKESLSLSEELIQNIKFRSLLLEREQLMSKVCYFYFNQFFSFLNNFCFLRLLTQELLSKKRKPNEYNLKMMSK
jgi:hypothetical protein